MKSGLCLVKNMDSTYKIKYTDSAINNLDHILSYLSDYDNPIIITNFKNEVKRKLDNIKSFPESHTVVFNQHGYDYRKLIIKNYIFVYYADKKNHEIVIFRFFHELEDYQDKLGINHNH